MSQLVTGKTLASRYRLEERLAGGGMGAVWRARDELLERPVAIKLLHDALSGDATAAERFRREALTAAQVSHPNLAQVYDYVEDEGRPAIVMELVEGETLAHRLARERRLAPDDAIGVADRVLAGLDAAHAAGIVHRDVKPGNILLTSDGDVKVTDFGIARASADAALTQTGIVMGTAHYAAPEQIRGDAATAATDLYQVGVVLYEMLAGRRPFEGDTPAAVAMSRLGSEPAPLGDARGGLPPALVAATMRALAREPRDRFDSASAMRRALGAGASPDATQALEVAPGDPTLRLRVVEDEEERARERRRIPPAWAIRRIVAWVAPLVALGALGFVLAGALDRPDETGAPPRPATSARAPATTPPPCCPVPDLTGLDEAAAADILERADLKLGKVTERETNEFPEGTVIDQSPAPDETVARGGEVDIVVAKAPGERDDDHPGKGKGRRH